MAEGFVECFIAQLVNAAHKHLRGEGRHKESEAAAPWPKHCPLCSCAQQSLEGQNIFAPSKAMPCLHFCHA